MRSMYDVSVYDGRGAVPYARLPSFTSFYLLTGTDTHVNTMYFPTSALGPKALFDSEIAPRKIKLVNVYIFKVVISFKTIFFNVIDF